MGRINQLNEKTTLNSTDVIAVDTGTGGTTNKMTGANLAGQLKVLGNYQDKLTFDTTPTADSNNPVTSEGVKTALDGKQNTLTFDTTPTAGSTNPVTSGGVATAISQSTAPLTWDNGTKPTLSNGSHYSYGTYYWKRGGLVYLCISAQFDSPPTNTLLFTLPAGYRPIGHAEITVSGGGSYNAKAQCRITDSGGVYVTSVDKWVTGSGLYIYAT